MGKEEVEAFLITRRRMAMLALPPAGKRRQAWQYGDASFSRVRLVASGLPQAIPIYVSVNSQ
jgi:hypothetical protein